MEDGKDGHETSHLWPRAAPLALGADGRIGAVISVCKAVRVP